MDTSEIEVANYLVKYYIALLPVEQWEALKHHKHTLKLYDMPDNAARRQLYEKANWLASDPEVLKLLDKGYINFILTCANQILKEHPHEVYINYCPECGKLARTPYAKQCRYCHHDWH